jgi:tRNA dimethylallyltransferase
VLVIVGPTASGKSELAVRLAEEFGGEVVNADSMQVYRGMEIGTARPSPELMERVPHHLFGFVSPEVNFTAADFIIAADAAIAEILSRGNIPVIAGGTGLYIRTLLGGLAPSPPADEPYRRELEVLADREGTEHLHALLARVDTVTADRLHVNDRVRIIRALEVFHRSGRPLSAYQQEHSFADQRYNALKIGIQVPRNILYQRIEQRVDAMIAAGLAAEIEQLLSQGYSADLKSMGAIGYREICGVISGATSLTEAVELIKKNTRRYAKRQLTWFKSDHEIYWLEYPETFDKISQIVREFIYRRSVK